MVQPERFVIVNRSGPNLILGVQVTGVPYLLEDTPDDLSVVFGTKPVSRSFDSLLRKIKKEDQIRYRSQSMDSTGTARFL